MIEQPSQPATFLYMKCTGLNRTLVSVYHHRQGFTTHLQGFTIHLFHPFFLAYSVAHKMSMRLVTLLCRGSQPSQEWCHPWCGWGCCSGQTLLHISKSVALVGHLAMLTLLQFLHFGLSPTIVFTHHSFISFFIQFNFCNRCSVCFVEWL